MATAKERDAAWRARNPEHAAELSRVNCKKSYYRHIEARRAYGRKYYHANKQKRKMSTRATRLKANYSITLEWYDAALKAQGGVCAICHEARYLNYGFLNVDHNHATGKVRGLLCNHCNQAIGLAHEKADVLEKMAKYVKEDGWLPQPT